MAPLSRRALLATAGSTVFAGCSTLSGEQTTATPYDVPDGSTTTTCEGACTESEPPVEGPEPLGTAAVPATADSLPDPTREWVAETDTENGVVCVQRDDGAHRVLLYTRDEDGFTAPELVTVTRNGDMTDSTAIQGLPSNTVFVCTPVEDQFVLGSHVYSGETRNSWLQGYRDGASTFEYRPDSETETVYSDVAAVADDIVAVGHDDATPESYEDENAIVSRIGLDGSVVWERRVESATTNNDLWAVTTTEDGIVCGGTEDNDPWVVAYDRSGRERWQRSLTRGEEAYIVQTIAADDTGIYALAQTNQFATGNNHLLALALDHDGTVRWTRVFDPNRADRSRDTPHNLAARGIIATGGPLLVGSADTKQVWLAKLLPDGSVTWAGYHQTNGRPTRPIGIQRVDGAPVVYGSTGELGENRQQIDPWMAWL